MADVVEVERKYSVGADEPEPPLTDLPGVEAVGPPAVHELDAVYFDTRDFALIAHRITLRRRTGGTDAGWHLKLPEGTARREIREPLGDADQDNADRDAVPDRLRSLVAAHVRGADLVPVARLRTRRTETPLLGAGGEVLAEFADDQVEAQTPPGAEPQSWREWELELVDGPTDLLDAADALLSSAGIHPAALPSKLARALGGSLPKQPAPPARPKRKGEAGVVLQAYLQRHVDALKAVDPGVRLDAPDAVHQLRVAARRMGSALATFRKLVDADAANALRAELQWLAGAVGEARDVEVMRERLLALLDAEAPELVVGPVAERVRAESDQRYRRAHDAGLAALGSDRYFRLLDTLDAFVADPPLTGAARKRAEPAVSRLLTNEVERLVAAVRAAEDAEDAADGVAGSPPHGGDPADVASQRPLDETPLDLAFHEARKAAKRLRYAAEAAAPVMGKHAKRLAKAASRIQETLGTHQDTVVSRAHLIDLAAQAHAAGESTFTYGRLHALEQERAADARDQFAFDWSDFVERR